MTVLTREILNALQSAGPVRFLNWSPEMSRRTIRMRLKRNWRILISVAKLIYGGRANGRRVYTVANADSGLYITALVAFIARWLGYRVYLHHHVYSYIDRYDRRMARIDRILGGHGVHVVHSDKMIADFRRCYPTKCAFMVVHPGIVPVHMGQHRSAARQPLRLGLLSSLSLEKGLDVVVEVFKTLRKAGRDVTLTLAGAAANTQSRRIIQKAVASYPGQVIHLGPVFDEEKTRFYADIDVFLFPTKSESWGLVLHEALAAGVPVITFDRGCTQTVVGPKAGTLIDPAESFIDIAVSQINRWIDCDDEYRSASDAAIVQARNLSSASRRTLAEFVHQMFLPISSPAASNAVGIN